jgi:hypothetical protein
MAGIPLTIGAVIGQDPGLLDPRQHITQGIGFPLQVLDVGLFAEVGYGGIESFAGVSISDIDATPQIIPATQGAVTVPQLVTQDFANNALVFLETGIYTVTIGMSLEFLGVNSARHYQIEVYNVDDDTVLISSNVPVGRNQEGNSTTHGFLLEVTQPAINELFSVRLVSSADTFTIVVLDGFAFNAIRIDRLRLV